MNKKNKDINRRGFLKFIGQGAVATSFFGCNNGIRLQTGIEKKEVSKDKMTYRTSSTTGDKVSILGYGCMRWPLKAQSDGSGEEIDQEAVNELIDYAIEHGINYFDTAPTYVRGMSEESTGIALKRHSRDKFLVATKLSTHRDSKELRSREGSIALYQESMRKLQVDYLDYYLLHGCGVGKPVNLSKKDMDETFDSESMLVLKERFFDNGILDYLIEERAAGRIRNLGWSFHGEQKVFDYMMSLQDSELVKWDFVQIQLNYIDWKYASGWNINAEYLYEEAAKRDIPIIVMEPLLGGRLSNMIQYLVERLKKRKPEKSVASWAFRYAASFPGVLTVLSGMTYMEHLQDNIDTYSPLEELSKDEFDLLADTAKRMMEYSSVPCTACQYCMPCPYGIDIPSIFSHYNKCINEGNVPDSTQSENYIKSRRAFLIGYDRSVPKLRQASRCIGCDQCTHHCPQAIKIPEQLSRIDRYAEELKQSV